MRKEAIAGLLVLIMLAAMGGYVIMNNDDNDVSNTGNDVTNEIQEDWSVYYVDSGNDLPACDSTTLGRLYYVVSNSVFEIEVAKKKYKASVLNKALHDPDNNFIRN